MTIRRSINPYELSGRLALVEACAERAPDENLPAYAAAEIIGEITTGIIGRLREAGIPNLPACDEIREVEAVIFGYVADANPDLFAEAEREGMALDVGGVDQAFASARAQPKSGPELYARYQALLAERGVGCDDWADLEQFDREAWDQIAEESC